MNANYQKVKDEWNQETDEKYLNYNPDVDINTIVSDPSRAFPKETFAMIRKRFPDCMENAFASHPAVTIIQYSRL